METVPCNGLQLRNLKNSTSVKEVLVVLAQCPLLGAELVRFVDFPLKACVGLSGRLSLADHGYLERAREVLRRCRGETGAEDVGIAFCLVSGVMNVPEVMPLPLLAVALVLVIPTHYHWRWKCQTRWHCHCGTASGGGTATAALPMAVAA